MKINLRCDSHCSSHTHFTVFVNGGNCGALCMSKDEAEWFAKFVQFGLREFLGKPFEHTVFELTGKWPE